MEEKELMKQDPEAKKENSHEGHRQRLKEKIRNFGLKSLAPHEVLEYLLYFTIARKNTNDLAHNLIVKFGSFSNVLDANVEEIMKIKGVGEESAVFLAMIPDLLDVYKQNKSELISTFIKNTHQSVEYFRSNHEIKNKEYLYVVCLNKSFKVVNTFEIKGVDDCTINFDMRELAEKISVNGTSAIIMFHTHPNGEVEPSRQDLETTQTILNVCTLLKISFCDHVILNETTHYSFGKHGDVARMYQNFANMFANQPIKPILRQIQCFTYD